MTSAARPAPVYIVHCIDTEGPLNEPLDTIFDRLDELYGINSLPRTHETLQQLRRMEIPLGGRERTVASAVAHGRACLGNWELIDEMLDRVMQNEFRTRVRDSYGDGWVYNWFCMDHVGFLENPRQRDLGFHRIYDHYTRRLTQRSEDAGRDEVHFHFHPISTYRQAHRCATHYLRSGEIYEILARKIIERRTFPSCFRAGFQAERPDSHWFLEQWFPFDFSNMAMEDNSELDASTDFRHGRSGDWRRAPADWSVYHPAHDDYQQVGACRRRIARCLNITSRIASVDSPEMNKAFARASGGAATVVGLSSHDFRDMGPEVDHVLDLVNASREIYPAVPVRFSGALEAMRASMAPESLHAPPLRLEVSLARKPADDVPHVLVEATEGCVFGPQPFLAIETRSGTFLHDNLDFAGDGRRWSYAFHADTLPLSDVRRIGIGAADPVGRPSVVVIDV